MTTQQHTDRNLTDIMWERHANPLSAWSRILSFPLLLEDERGYGYVAPVDALEGEQIIFHRKTQAPPTGRVLQDNRPSELMVTDLNRLENPQRFLEDFQGRPGWVTFSPSGEQLAFIGDDAAHWQFFVTPTDTFDPAQISQNAGPRIPIGPTWKPDGSRLAFIENTSDPTVTLIVSTDPDGSNHHVAYLGRGIFRGDYADLVLSRDAQ